MLTLESTGEAVYASDTRESANSGQSTSREQNITVVSDSGYGQRPVTVKELYPTFRGAVVLCEGADNIHVRCAVVEAVSTLCGIGADKVAVLKMQGAESGITDLFGNGSRRTVPRYPLPPPRAFRNLLKYEEEWIWYKLSGVLVV